MPSASTTTLARCQFCGREFDSRGFQVFVAGMRGTFDSAECALRAAAGETSPDRARAPEGSRERADDVR
jgi:hypothetical protein